VAVIPSISTLKSPAVAIVATASAVCTHAMPELLPNWYGAPQARPRV